ncbi:hypothetical protein GO755_12310 [Spirosoma sp. HMF4905]|uniref:Uncharacterized protein n=1 Tax=Spirosoma arboris TaxID=2682092 RepID=A0A7K1SB80_9BACT|nr:hypothetical protein [Spirosoma arboris]MVM30816.1 hypothetical protein [Spirosoma arboris]
MRTLVLYILLFATLLPTVSQWGIIAHYQLDKDYIARVLCENRNKPQLHCDGQCYLAKQLKAQQEKQDKETTERVQNSPVIQLFYQAGFLFQFIPVWKLLLSAGFPAYRFPSYVAPLESLFQPPQV